MLVSVAALLAAAPAAAQTPPPDGPNEPSLTVPGSVGEIVVVHAGRLLDRPGRAPRGPSSVIIRDGRVVAVVDGHVALLEGAALATPRAEFRGDAFTANRNARVVDLRDRFVLPGLIDSHVHLDSDRAGVEGQLASVTDSVALSAYEAAWNARKTLDAGFTTVRNLGDSDGVTLGLRDAIARGWAVGPRIVDAGSSISATTGHMDPTLGFRDELHAAIDRHDNLCDGPEECRKAVRQQISRGVDVIKIATTGGVNSRIGLGLGAQMFDDEAKAIVDTAHLYGKKVAVHAHGDDGIALAVRAGADSIEHGTLMSDATARLMAQRGTWYVPTLSTVNGYLERIAADPNAYAPAVREKIDWRIRITGEALRRAVPRGVKIAFGTDAGVSKHGRNADEFELMVKHGMTPAAALQAATVNAADLLGLSAEVGTLEPGKRADLIAVQGDPLRDVTVLKRVGFVMKDGRVHKHER
jgi:imidazolonepropionase-like amidohydrolase